MAETSLKIGISVSMSGRYALLGRQVLAGIECYVADVNCAGGIVIGTDPKRLVELIAYDDQSETNRCADLVDQLIERDHVDILMGPYGSGPSLAAARVAETANVVMWNHSGSADKIFEQGFRWLVGIISPASNYLRGIVELVKARDPSAHRIAIVSAQTGFADDVAIGARRAAEDIGFIVQSHQRYPSGATDFSSIIGSLDRERPDCLLCVGRVEDDLLLARSLCTRGIPIKAVGLVVAAIDQFKVELGDAAGGFLAPSQWEPDAVSVVDYGPSANDFAIAYRSRTSEPLDYPAVQGYAGCLIAQHCLETGGSLEQSVLRETANNVQCATLYGAFKIDPSTGRQLGHRMLVTQWQSGQKRVVWPESVANATVLYPRLGPSR
ncbi:MAG: branched-chain amino acid transport system substrate-binding protein [Gammaproteobacteria bacterium]|jgi:branched-chain amino acid transport system substrate-binding protein